MGKTLQLLIATLLSACSLATAAEGYPAFAPMPKEYLSAPGEVIEVRNMPDVRNQGGLSICFGMSAWTVYMQAQCRATGSGCKAIQPEQAPSPLVLAALGANSDFTEKHGSKIIPYSSMGSGAAALYGMSSITRVLAESCYPWGQFVEKHHGNASQIVAVFSNLKSNFFEQNKQGKSICMDCLLRTLRADFDLNLDLATVEKALGEETYDQFLYDVFLKPCKTKVGIAEIKVRFWPGAVGGQANANGNVIYQEFISTIRNLFKSNHPATVGLCLNEKLSAEQCKNGHEVVLSGYRNVCRANGQNCADYIKVHNSWGSDWQRRNSDGWIDAKIFFDYMHKDEHALAWIE